MEGAGKTKARITAVGERRARSQPAGKRVPELGPALEAAIDGDLETRVGRARGKAIEEETEEEEAEELGEEEEEPEVDPETWDDSEYGEDLDYEREAVPEGEREGGLWPEAPYGSASRGRGQQMEPALSIDRFGDRLVSSVVPSRHHSSVRAALLEKLGEFLIEEYEKELAAGDDGQLTQALRDRPVSQKQFLNFLTGKAPGKDAVSRFLRDNHVRVPGLGVIPVASFFGADERRREHRPRAIRDSIKALIRKIMTAEPKLTRKSLHARLAHVPKTDLPSEDALNRIVREMGLTRRRDSRKT